MTDATQLVTTTTGDGASQSTQSPQYNAIIQRLSLLETAMLDKDPQMKVHLGEIHRLMIGHEELVHLLKDEEIGKIMSAQQIVTDTTLVAASTGTKGKASASKKAAQLTMDML